MESVLSKSKSTGSNGRRLKKPKIAPHRRLDVGTRIQVVRAGNHLNQALKGTRWDPTPFKMKDSREVRTVFSERNLTRGQLHLLMATFPVENLTVWSSL